MVQRRIGAELSSNGDFGPLELDWNPQTPHMSTWYGINTLIYFAS